MEEFGPKALKAVRQSFVDRGACRTYVNQLTQKIRRIFRWAVSEELTPPATYQALQAVPGLKRGRCTVRESEPVNPVPKEHLQAVKAHLSRQVWALIQAVRQDILHFW